VQASSAPTQTSPKQLAGDLLRLWHRVLRGSSRQLYALLGELDLSMTQMKLLHTLADHDAQVSIKELGAEVGLSLPGASRAIDSLLRRGLVERQEDPADRRCKRIGITASGRDAVERVENARLAGLEDFTSSLTPEQRDRLATALSDLPLAP
jgi:DNA-binding MarR family transcriptional regulator